jgi:hypothetical protein
LSPGLQGKPKRRKETQRVTEQDCTEALYSVHDEGPVSKRSLSKRDIVETVNQVLARLQASSAATQHSDSEEDDTEAMTDLPSDEDGENTDFSPSRKSARAIRSQLWRGFSAQVHRIVPSVPQPAPMEKPSPKGRLVPMSQFDRPESDLLPLQPNILQALKNCERELRDPDPKASNKSDGKAGPYEVGTVLNIQGRKNFPRFFYPSDVPAFARPMDPKSQLSSFLDKAQSPCDSISFSDKEMKDQEMEAKRMISTQSVLHWGHDALENLTDQLSRGRNPDEVVEDLRILLQEQREAIPVLEDCLCTHLSNIVLRRRDMLLKSLQYKDLSPEALVKLRASKLTGKDLLEVDVDLFREERKHRSEQTMFHIAKAAASAPSTSSSKGKGKQPYKKRKQQSSTSVSQPQQQQQGKGNKKGKGKGSSAYTYTGYQRQTQSGGQPQSAQGNQGSQAQAPKGRGRGGKGGKQAF